MMCSMICEARSLLIGSYVLLGLRRQMYDDICERLEPSRVPHRLGIQGRMSVNHQSNLPYRDYLETA